MSYVFPPSDVMERTNETNERSPSLDLNHLTSEEEAGEDEDTFPDELGPINEAFERADPFSKIRRKISSTIMRSSNDGMEVGSGSRCGSTEIGRVLEPTPNRRRRRLALSVTGPFQRLFNVDEPTTITKSRSNSVSSLRPSLSSFRRTSSTTTDDDWDFMCQGVAPPRPPRSDTDELGFIDSNLWMRDCGLECSSPTSSPTSAFTNRSMLTTPSPTHAVHPPSPTSPTGGRITRPTKVSIETISAPMISPPIHRSYFDRPRDVNPLARSTILASNLLASCTEPSD